MQFAIVDNTKQQAFPKGRGACPICGNDVIAKCGNRKVHHWAHAHIKDCDPWWENETVWHREWKAQFPEEWCEVSHVAEDGEIHRADIKTASGLVIEVQHSSMTDEERISREEFYGNMIWVVDGRAFQKNFHILHILPSPTSQIAQDIVWFKSKHGQNGSSNGLYWKLSEHEGSSKINHPDGKWVHSLHLIEDAVVESYAGHRQFDWVRPRQTWLESSVPVFIDFGEPFLILLDKYDEYQLPCIRVIPRWLFVEHAKSLKNATEVGIGSVD